MKWSFKYPIFLSYKYLIRQDESLDSTIHTCMNANKENEKQNKEKLFFLKHREVPYYQHK